MGFWSSLKVIYFFLGGGWRRVKAFELKIDWSEDREKKEQERGKEGVHIRVRRGHEPRPYLINFDALGVLATS
jgi:hypothetical protein